MSFTSELRHRAADLWAAELAHPFVRGIGDGSLALDRFRYYVCQDYVFLIEYSRVLALAAARADDLETMGRWADLLHATLNVEMNLHRGYCARLGIPAAELEATTASPTTHAYTRHLLAVAWSGTLAELVAALLPCQWGYAEIGQALAARGVPEQPFYAEWIAMYANEEFAALARWARDLLDRLAEQASPAERARLTEIFLTSSRYEYLFWDAAHELQEWPL